MKNDKESYILLVKLFYLFIPTRTYQDIKNSKFNGINEIAMSYAIDETLFYNKYCNVELNVYLKNKQLNGIQYKDYSEFLFFVFHDHIKSHINVESINFSEKNVIVHYNFIKSISEFLSSKGINKTLIFKGDNKSIEFETKLFPSSTAIYNNFISKICKIHSVNEKSFEKPSLDETKSRISKITKSFKNSKSKEANKFSAGFIVYILPIIIAIIGAYILLFKPQGILYFIYHYLGQVDTSWQPLVLIGYIYVSVIVSLMPAIIFWLINIGNTSLSSDYHDETLLQPFMIVGGILLYSLITVIIGFILAIILYIVVGIGSIFFDYKTDPTVELILNFFLKLTAFVVFIGVSIPLFEFYKLIRNESSIVKKIVIIKTILISIILIFCVFIVYSLTDIKTFNHSQKLEKGPTSELRAPVGKMFIVTAGIAYLRSGPSKKFQIIGQLMKNDSIEVLSEVY